MILSRKRIIVRVSGSYRQSKLLDELQNELPVNRFTVG